MPEPVSRPVSRRVSEAPQEPGSPGSQASASVPRGTGSTVAEVVWPWRRAEEERAGEEERQRQSARWQGLFRGLVGLSAAALIWWLWGPLPAAVVATIACGIAALALVSPTGAYRRLDRWVMRFARGVGWAVTWVLMPLLYWLTFLPLGAFLRLRGSLRLERRPVPDLESYWIARQDRGDRTSGKASEDRYRRQF